MNKQLKIFYFICIGNYLLLSLSSFAGQNASSDNSKICLSLKVHDYTTGPRDFCFGIKTDLKGTSCDDLKADYENNATPKEICIALNVARQKEGSCKVLRHKKTTSPRDICTGMKAAIEKKRCEALEDHKDKTSPKDVCIGMHAALNGLSCDDLKDYKSITSPKDICIGIKAGFIASQVD